MTRKLVLAAVAAAIVTLAGCAKSQTPDTKTAMQKRYNSLAECQKDFPVANDCTRHTSTSGGGGYFMSPFFYPWGGVYHSNGMMSYNQRVPSSGYSAAPAYAQQRVAARTNFSRVPSSYGASHGSSTRGGFGGTARSSSSSSFGG